MDRRRFLTLAAALPALPQSLESSKAIPEPHFPSRLYCFVWRNWEITNTDRIAKVLGTSERNVLAIGRSMGLPEKPRLTDDQLRRIYITVIRQNWHVLPEAQLIELLGWDKKKLDFTLKEDDFLDVKLGRNKPQCEPLRYAAPTEQEKTAAVAIRQALRKVFGKALHVEGQPPFRFIDELNSRGRTTVPSFVRDTKIEPGPMRAQIDASGIHLRAPNQAALQQLIYLLEDEVEAREKFDLPLGTREYQERWTPRYLYSYFALYGDPLLDPTADPFPSGYLEKLARCGINGVWLQGLLNTLAPAPQFPEFGEGSQIRLRNLAAMCDRASNFGVKVYLYLNEPRAMPEAFFSNRAQIRGSKHHDLYAMCTSTQQVRTWLADSLAHVFKNVPQLGGVFTISSSENHTNCFSHGGAWRKEVPNAGDCPRCTKRESWEVFAEMFGAMREGIRRSSATAEIIHYDWGWPDDLSAKMIPLLDRDTHVLSISEWNQPVERGGVKTQVGEYSISVTGPGPRATRNWKLAKDAGIKTLAKVQFNNTWEISAVPYIPVPHLILEHCQKLRAAGVDGLMPSWTCGGYPSPNLAAAKAYYYEEKPDHEAILRRLASQRYGAAAVTDALDAWSRFSDAFREFPYGVSIYIIPTQHGPANLLRLEPTGHRPGMILFPHDAMKAWCGRYPPAVVVSQFRKMAGIWKSGLSHMDAVNVKSSSSKRTAAAQDVAIARTCYHHFESVANQVEFYTLRDDVVGNRARLIALAEAEIELARKQYDVARGQSTIGYEASNHYYYLPLDLAEKVLNCQSVISRLRA
jgi:hypothetical protein